MPPRVQHRLRKLCLSLPETHEVEAWGEPTFRVLKGKMFATFSSANNHHGAGRHAVWVKAKPENQQLMLRSFPGLYFSPPYVGPSGWIGAWLDDATDWDEIAELLKDGWRLCAPKRTLARFASTLEAPAKPELKKRRPRAGRP